MKKLFLPVLLSLVVLGVITHKVSAQVTLGAQLGLIVPVDGLDKDLSLGVGTNLNVGYFLTPKVAVGLSLGFGTFNAETTTTLLTTTVKTEDTQSILGITPKVQYFLTEKGFRPYIGTDIGYYILGAKTTSTTTGILNTSSSSSSSKGYFGVAPHLGFLLDISSKLAVDLNVKYNMIFTSTTLPDGSKTSNIAMIPISAGLLYTFGK